MIRILALFMLAVVFMMMMIAVFDKNNISGEPPIGTYETFDFNDGWLLTSDKSDEEITLPFSPDESYGNQLDISLNGLFNRRDTDEFIGGVGTGRLSGTQFQRREVHQRLIAQRR